MRPQIAKLIFYLIAIAAIGTAIFLILGGISKKLDKVNPRLLGTWYPETKEDDPDDRIILTIFEDRIFHNDLDEKKSWTWQIGRIQTQWGKYYILMQNPDGSIGTEYCIDLDGEANKFTLWQRWGDKNPHKLGPWNDETKCVYYKSPGDQ